MADPISILCLGNNIGIMEYSKSNLKEKNQILKLYISTYICLRRRKYFYLGRKLNQLFLFRGCCELLSK